LPSVSDLEQAAALLASAHAAGRRVEIGSDLTTERLDSIVEHEPGDLTCVVEAGVRLSVLAEALAAHGQRLALDPPGDPTVGSVLAANLSGPLRHRFGSPRDLVLGVTLVLADGTIASSGGKVVKNVAGYDLGKLVCGSRGTLALIGRVSLRLHPVPAVARTLVIEIGEPAGAVAALLRAPLQPSALDVLHPGRVAVLFEGGDAGVEAQLDAARRLVGGDEASADVWAAARAMQGQSLGRVRFDPGHLAAVLAALDEAVVRPSAGVAYVPHEVPSDLPAATVRLHERIRSTFDPSGVFVGA
jgi:glycolate oxidase FAD binding subunit